MPYFERLQQLLLTEQNEDRRQFQAQIERFATAERRSLGLTWYPVAIRGSELNQADYVTVEFERTTHQDIHHQFRFGSQAALFSNHDAENDRIVGTVAHVSKNNIKINFKTDELPDWSRMGKLGIDVLFDENSYKEMFNAIKDAEAGLLNGKNNLISILVGNQNPEFSPIHFDYTNVHLNESQNRAVSTILQARHLAIVHGPPGTGKTTTLIEAIKALVKQKPNEKILVCAPSNTAVDLLCKKLHLQHINVVRIGNPTKVNDYTLALTLDNKVANHEAMRDVKKLKKQASEYKSMAHKYKRNFGKDERDQRKLLFEEAYKILKDADKIEQFLIADVLDKAQVVATTLVGANQYSVKGNKYDTIIIDEAGQALEPACWIPILKANKVVLAGDHCQLPPTIKSNEAIKELSITLLEKSIKNHPSAVVLLEEQYRMHHHIMQFSSDVFYDGKLKAHATVAKSKLNIDWNAFTYIDTAGCSFEEKMEGTSLTNPDEAAFLIQILTQIGEALTKTYASDKLPSIGVVSPYKKQVDLLNTYFIESNDLKKIAANTSINTIDSFQGQERDIMLLSMTRSNAKGEIGFLADIRRMNVAMTRAKKILIIIGDSSTLSYHSFYKKLVTYAESIHAYKSAWELMDV
jgi:ATP-dependent RNA/DNA helicase IGHMBP2